MPLETFTSPIVTSSLASPFVLPLNKPLNNKYFLYSIIFGKK